MALPDVDRSRLLEALTAFDSSERQSATWRNWEQDARHRYAIVYDGKRYPVKEIVSKAVGVPTSSFGGGNEANAYVAKRGFTVESINFPAEGEVQAALHDLLLARAPQFLEPADAYQILADRFELSEYLRNKPMEDSDEIHWQNRVRQALRKLVNARLIDPADHGRWKLATRTFPKFWVEKTLVKGRPDRSQGPNALGASLWSPTRAQNGSDIYRNMRLIQPGDIVLHLTDNSAFTGISIAGERASTNFQGIDGTDWAGLPCYRIPLRDFIGIAPPLARMDLTATEDSRRQLIEIRGRHQNLFYDPDLNLHQGGYLTEAPRELVSLLDNTYHARTGRHLAPFTFSEEGMLSQTSGVEESREEQNIPPRVWLYAPGRNADRWGEFRATGIAAIGWDEVGDLGHFPNREAVKAKLDEVYEDGQSLVNASQCFDFAHRMRPGDLVFAKRGRREIVGFGVIAGPYRFAPDRSDMRHVRNVDWQHIGTWPLSGERMLSMKTVTEITHDEELVARLEELVGLSKVSHENSIDPETPAETYSITQFSTETKISEALVGLWLQRLRRKQQLIFQGPPGTGKTFIAERLARLLVSETFGVIDTVQFHPSYGYEDFMQGIRPIVADGQLLFERLPGRFVEFCGKARTARDTSPCVLIIDEINRGNLSRIFGELMFLLEYREKRIPLAGDTKPFGIPPNVYVIGTMNTADRSIALVDHALRRRFSFVHLAPDYEVLQKQLGKHGLDGQGLAEALKAVNAAIDDRNYEVGISFFLKDGAELASHIKEIWEGEIEPYLEEFFYDQPGKLEPLRWRTLIHGPLAAWTAGE